MLNRLTEEARQALVMAQQAARGLRYDSLDSGTLLLGLLTDHADAAIRALAQQGITFEAVRGELQSRRPPSHPAERKGAVPYTAEAKALLDAAFGHSHRLKHDGVLRTGHLVLAMARRPECAAAQIMRALGADFAVIELAVTANHVPSLPEPDLELSDEFRAMLVHQAGLAWPRPRIHLLSGLVTMLWYLGTLALLVAASPPSLGPELVIGLTAVILLPVLLVHAIRLRWTRRSTPAGVGVAPCPPELTALVATWGITDFAIWLRNDYRLDDHAIRIGSWARIGVSREVFHRPAESGYVIAHELAHLLRHDPARGVAARWLERSLILPAVLTFTPWIWGVAAASILLHRVVNNWTAELGSDHIAVTLHGPGQMASWVKRTFTSTAWPSTTHPPYAWRLWLARRSRGPVYGPKPDLLEP
ncbi:Clp protease N-terminal domain-containing protein [Catellatospora sp. NPDC049133]|jgi:Zn-dependent protease with chaperone function|uniref:Clp protease N-terminal domain-containing protein n=1 Tax=Catellatospora sp. NPDC049133 TaxID=3155499 RepID=UPI0033E2B57C